MADWSGGGTDRLRQGDPTYSYTSRRNAPNVSSAYTPSWQDPNAQDDPSGGGQSGGNQPGGQQQQAPPGGSQSPTTDTGKISPQYTTPSAYYNQGTYGYRTEDLGPGTSVSARTDYALNDAKDIIRRAYRDQLGREPSDAEIMTHIQNQGWKTGDRWVGSNGLNYILNQIHLSPEAEAYRNRPQDSTATSTATTTTTTNAEAAPAQTAAPAASTATGTATTTTSAAPTGGPAVTSGDPNSLDSFAAKFGTYTPSTLPQFNAPDYSGYEGQTLEALSNALNNSEWSPERVAAMKEVQKEQANQQFQDLETQLQDRFAGMGRANSGLAQAGLRRAGESNIEAILKAYRDVNEQAASGRRNELLQTAGALDNAMNSGMGRATGAFDAQFKGAAGQADENYRGWESQFTPYELALKKALGEAGIGVDWGRIGESGRQFDLSHALALQQFLENQRQFNERLGLDWTQLGVNQLGSLY